MSKVLVDARGLPCPQPVIQSREAISREGIHQVDVLVDDMAQVENVISMARNLGWSGKISKQQQNLIKPLEALKEQDFYITGAAGNM